MIRSSLLLFVALSLFADTSPRSSVTFLGRWTFDAGDARDTGGAGAHGRVKGVTFEEGCAVFGGEDSGIEFPVRAADLRQGFRTLDVEIRAWLETPAYYGTLVSHPLVTVAVNTLGTGKGRPCFLMANLTSVLAPDEEHRDTRWGRGPCLSEGTDRPFYYGGWVGHGEVVVPVKTWVTIRTVYDGNSVAQYLDGRLVATHAIRNAKARVSCDPGTAATTATIGKLSRDIETPTTWSGRIDYVVIKGTR